MQRFVILTALMGLLLSPLAAEAQDLALKRVLLSSGGLGYFEYEANVEGDATLKLTVALGQVDDVLKSLVVYDDKGGVGGLSLPGREPLAQTFKDLPFDQDALRSPAALLATLKGAEIFVGGRRALSGRVVSVQEETTSLGGDGHATTTRTRVTLMTDRGLQQFILEDAEDLQFADPVLRDKIGQALVALSSNRAKDARTLELSMRGEGKRIVRVAYIVEAPVWKASYRLTLPADAAAPKAALQGWATIENLSGQDWKDVELTLVSGRPVAFRQALYNAYYVNRPEVPVEVTGRLVPGVDRGGVAIKAAGAPQPAPPMPAPAQQRSRVERMSSSSADSLSIASAAEPAEATDAATQVTFKFPRPVTVTNGRTLSIPVIDRQLPAQRLALYEPNTSARNPIAALKLVNDGETGLPPGILTLYERDKAGAVAYVGDARLSAFPAGETRLVAYAVDQKIVIEREAAQAEQLATGSIAQGILHYSNVVRQTVAYRIKGPAAEPRQLIVVQPRLAGWSLVKPDVKGVEVSEGNYRVPFQLPGGDQTQTLEIVQERTTFQEVRLLDAPPDQIKVFAQAREFDAKTRDMLTRIIQLQQGLADARQRGAKIAADRDRIVEDQGRLRENLGQVPPNSDLQRRYLASLDKQETELEALKAREAAADKAVETAESALQSYILQAG